MRFARVFEFKTGQLLVTIAIDSENEGYLLSLETYYQGTHIRTGLPFASFGDASESMDELSEQKAEALYRSILKIAEEPPKPKGISGAIEGFENWLKNSNN